METRAVALKFVAAGLALSLSAGAATFQETWNATQEGPYTKLPQHPTTNASFFISGVNVLAKDAKRTLEDSSDVLPRFQKLVHPIGICYAGTWRITQQTPYTGFFAKGSEGLIIVRASEAMGLPNRGNYRAFGIAGKIFPTTDEKDPVSYKTANFFTVDDLGGTKSDSFLDLPKTNEPAVSIHLSSVWILPMIHTISKAFSAADGNPAFRPVKAIAELGLSDPSAAVSPKWLQVKPESKALSVQTKTGDFRQELRLKNFRQQTLEFSILVSGEGEKVWNPIGKIELTQEALSEGCDHRLHFPHPRLKK